MNKSLILRPGATLKQNVLSSRLKPPYVMSSSRKWAGRLFQTRGPATAKLLSPNVLCVVCVERHTICQMEMYVVGEVRRCVARQRREEKTC